MKKKTLKNALVKLIVVLLIVLVSLISFLGIHKRNLNTWKSILPDYQFSKDLSEIRTFEFSVDTSTKDKSSDENATGNTTENATENTTNTVAEGTTETTETTDNTTDENATNTTNTTAEQVPVNDPTVLTKENYVKTKKIVEKRLKDFGIPDAEVTVNEKNGKISVSVPYEGTTDYSAALASQKGKIEIVDSETKEVLMDRSMIKKAAAYYQQANNNKDSATTTDDKTSYNLGVKLTFTSEGQKKLNELSKTYIETTNENGEASQKTITVQIDGEDKYITYFTPDGEYTELAVPLYRNVSTDDMETFNSNYKDCFVTQTVLNNDEFPITYKLTSGSFIESGLGENFVKGLSIAGIVILAIVIVLTIIKNKKDGFFASIIEIGYIAILLLIIRAASVSLTLSGILTIAVMSIINYFLLLTFMKTEKAIDKLEKFGNFVLTIIPFIITIVVFALGKEVNTQSIGSVGIWGTFGLIYTLIAAIFLIDGKKAKKNGVE